MVRASVIVPARDAAATLGRTLTALAEQRFDGGYEVIVVDDGSTDATAEIAAHAGRHRVTLLRQPRLGPAAARNRGVAQSQAPLLAFCDADVYPTPGWLAAGTQALEWADLVQGRVLPDPAVSVGPFDRTLWITTIAGLWETANLFCTRTLFDRVGGFEQWLQAGRGKALAEDVWFGHRAVRHGARTAFCGPALAHHAVFARGRRGYVAERIRLRHFPAMIARMPELRDSLCHRRWFLTERGAEFDLALAAALLGLRRRSPLPLLAAIPYARRARAHSGRGPARSGRPAQGVLAVDVVADAVGLAAMLVGSARTGALLL